MDEIVYNFRDSAAAEDKARAMALCARLNALPPEDMAARESVLRELFAAVGERPAVMPEFHCDVGKNIRVGDDFLANFGVTVLDRAPVHIGSHVMLGPGVLITTVNHPLSASARRSGVGIARPVTIGDDVWIGGNATVLPGVTVGSGAVIAAGAVVTRDVPPNTLAAGVPARIVRTLEE